MDDDGNPNVQADKLEDLAKSVTGVLEQAYPPIYRHIVPLHLPGVGSCLAVVVPGSPSRPHFAGQPYVRVGPETKSASEEQFARLISIRQAKTFEVLKYIGEAVVRYDARPMMEGLKRFEASHDFILVDCNAHYLTLARGKSNSSIPLDWVDLSFDHAKKLLALYVKTPTW